MRNPLLRRRPSWHLGPVDNLDHPKLVTIWDEAVRASHHFLQPDDLQHYRELFCHHYLNWVRLTGLRDQHGQLQGFIGTYGNRLVLLFVHPRGHGHGYGRALLSYAVEQLGVEHVEVHEQNREALGFYLSQGFVRSGRSPVDGAERPYPVAHLTCTKNDRSPEKR